ncbi:MAG: ABC-type multidrug transport system fused ATPase/permease subunit [Pseudohongiellaceae bacterium]
MSEPKPPRFFASPAFLEAKELVSQHRKRLGFGLGLLMVNRLSGLVLPASSKILIDNVIGQRQADWLWPLAIAGAVATLIQAGTRYSLSITLGVAAQKAINDLRATVQAHVTRLPISRFDATQTGVLISRVMTDAEGIRNLVGTGLVQLVGGLLTAILAMGVLFFLNWQMTAIILVVIVVFAAAMARAFRKLRPLFRERSAIRAEITGRLGQGLSGIRVVKAYVAEAQEEAVFRKGIDRLFENIRASMTGISATSAMAIAIVGLIGSMLTIMGGTSILAGEMTMGDFVMYLLFIGLVVGPVVQIAEVGTQITEAFAGLDRIREIRQESKEDAGDELRQPCPAMDGDLAFEDVHFEYEPGKPVLKGISFTAPAGSTTALVGSSGSGKSTLVSLVMAFNRPQSGRVTVDGKDLAELRLADFRSHLGVVMQETFLFDGTVADNIAFSQPQASRDDIEAAARLAHCGEFVDTMPEGYDTIVGERGVKLSGGQRQRVAIARALLADPSLLILDEATSSLDSESEAMIQEGLAALRTKRTTFVIAHRLSTIRSAEQILVIEDGCIVESGRHSELLAQDGRYRELYDRQYRFEHERFVNPGEEFPGEPGLVPSA